MPLPTAIIADPIYAEHDPGPGHPECPGRYDAVVEGIRQGVDPQRLRWITPRCATEEDVALCHTPEYIHIVKEDIMDSVRCLRTGDTDLSDRSFEVALHAVGGVLDAVDAVMAGEAANAFCVVRPPGHHASAARGQGFCIFNNVAIAARYAQARHGIERVLIADWDVHHGNGTQAIFDADPSVFYFSTHQWPLYPGTGATHDGGSGEGAGATVNCPVGMGSGRHEIAGAVRDRLVPAMRTFRPEFVFISAGFDARGGDPVGGLALTDDDFAALTRFIREIADVTAQGRIVSALEGGYALAGLASAAAAHVRSLAEIKS